MDGSLLFVSLVSQKSEVNNHFCNKKQRNKQATDSEGILSARNRQKQANKQKTYTQNKKLGIQRGKQHLPPVSHCRCLACAPYLSLLKLVRHILFLSPLWMRKLGPGEVRQLACRRWVTEDAAGIEPWSLTLEPGTVHNSPSDLMGRQLGKCRLNRKQHSHL